MVRPRAELGDAIPEKLLVSKITPPYVKRRRMGPVDYVLECRCIVTSQTSKSRPDIQNPLV